MCPETSPLESGGLWGGWARLWGLYKQGQRGGWDGNGDEIGTEWEWLGVRDREEHLKRVEWDGNGVGMKGMGTEVGLDGVGKGMR